jgi:hypothetical protein
MTTTEPTQATDIASAVEAYLRVWNEPDDATRADKARHVFTADARLADPLIDATGPEAIADAIGGLRTQMPGLSLVPTSGFDTHHDLTRFSWAAQGPDGTVAVAGLDLLTLTPAGQISSSIAFFGDLPEA